MEKIKCVQCGYEIPIEQALLVQVENKLKKSYEEKENQQKVFYQQQKKAFEAEKLQLLKTKEQQEQHFKQAFENEKLKIKQQAELSAKETYESELKALSAENEKRKSENKLLREKELDLLRKENEIKEKQELFEVEFQKKLLEQKQVLSLEFQQKASENKELLVNQKKAFEAEKLQLLKTKEQQEQHFKQAFENEKLKIKQQAELSAKENYESELKALSAENEKRKSENKLLREKELDLLRKENEIKEKQELFEVEFQKKLLEQKSQIENETKQKEREQSELKYKEYEKKLEDQMKLIDEMKRKAEQGSMQMQGEVQELALEDLLRHDFRYDDILEVPKGVMGADVIQLVKNPFQQICGKIIYESKRTKAFSKAWIEKLKNDLRSQQADLAVIVTEVMPEDMSKFGNKEGVWICTFNEVSALAFVLREMLIKTHAIQTAQENKGDKMVMLYNYLTGNEFKQQVEAIVEGFTTMKEDLDKEKRAMQKLWKEREKQLEKVISNTVDMYGSIKGIAGKAISDLKALELPDKQLSLENINGE